MIFSTTSGGRADEKFKKLPSNDQIKSPGSRLRPRSCLAAVNMWKAVEAIVKRYWVFLSLIKAIFKATCSACSAFDSSAKGGLIATKVMIVKLCCLSGHMSFQYFPEGTVYMRTI